MCLLDIIDTAGQEEYSAFRDRYVLSADGLLVVYDVTRYQTLDEARHIHEWSLNLRDGTTLPAVSVFLPAV